ncbi:WYL domain-containing protein [Dyadobacter tibetensis]|uniref:WYL domain-containing protein n=1 Tax=Dyadobacter tibetensis TaxID=1211851 RepID=UPI0009FDDE7C
MYAIYFSGAIWSIIAFCEIRQEIREFRLDRIKELKLQQTHFNSDKTFSMGHYMEERSIRLFLNS